MDKASPTPTVGKSVVALDAGFEPLRAAFHAASGQPRLVVLLSPT